MVLLLGVDRPDVRFVGPAFQHVVDRRHGGEHGVVHVVVAVHAVAADQEEVLERIEPALKLAESAVGAEVGGIRFGHPDHRAVDDGAWLDDSDLGQLPGRQVDELRVGLDPQIVVLVAEILHPDPDLGRIGDHVRAPVVEDLHPAHQHVGLLDVDPVVADQLGPPAGPALDFELIHQEPHGDEVAVDEPLADPADRVRRIHGERSHQLLDRHRGEAVVGLEEVRLAGCGVDGLHGEDAASGHVDAADLQIREHPPSHVLDFPGDLLPHLPGAVLRIQELLDERGLGTLLCHVAWGEGPLERVQQGLGDRQALDPLGAPFGTDPGAGKPPDLLRVGLEKGVIQLAAEPIDEELLQARGVADGKEHAAGVAQTDLQDAQPSELAQGVPTETDGVVEELALVVNPRVAGAKQHHAVGFVGVGPVKVGSVGVGFARLRPALVAAHRRWAVGRLQRHAFKPPLHHAVRLGEEAVAADVDAVALVVDGPRQPAHVGALFQDDRLDVGALEEFVGGRQPGRARADDHRGFRIHVDFLEVLSLEFARNTTATESS